MDNKTIHLKKRKHTKIIQLKNIETIEISIPMYTGIPGSLYNYAYTFKIVESNSNSYRFSMILEKNEEKEIIKSLQDENINVVIKYYDNKNNGID